MRQCPVVVPGCPRHPLSPGPSSWCTACPARWSPGRWRHAAAGTRFSQPSHLQLRISIRDEIGFSGFFIHSTQISTFWDYLDVHTFILVCVESESQGSENRIRNQTNLKSLIRNQIRESIQISICKMMAIRHERNSFFYLKKKWSHLWGFWTWLFQQSGKSAEPVAERSNWETQPEINHR